MSYDKLKKVINNKNSISYKNGYNIFKCGKANIIDSRVIENNLNIYGRIESEVKTYATHIRFDGRDRYYLKCNCELSRNIKSTTGYACEHVIATILTFLKINHIEEKNYKNYIEFDIRLEESYCDNYMYDCYLYDRRNNKKIGSVYQLEDHLKSYTLDDKYMELVEEIRKQQFHINNIYSILYHCRDMQVVMKLKSIEYNVAVKHCDMPLKFTLKMDGDRIRLQTLKKKIMPLDKAFTSFLYDGTIYLPSSIQCKGVSVIYKALKGKNYTFVNKKSLDRVTRVLSDIGEVKIYDEVKNLLIRNYVYTLYFFIEDNKICCRFVEDGFIEAVKDNSKIRFIEEILYRNRFTKGDNYYMFLGSSEELFSLFKSHALDVVNIKTSNDLRNLKILSSSELDIDTWRDRDASFMELRINNLSIEEIKSCIEAYNNGDRFFMFSDYSFVDFGDSDICRIFDTLSILNYSGGAYVISEAYEEFINASRDTLDIYNSVIECNEVMIHIPRELYNTLREYQRMGLKWIQSKKDKSYGCILADDMGLGKTIQAISFLMNNIGDKSIVVTKTSLIYNWKQEFDRYGRELKVAYIHGDRIDREDKLKNMMEYDVIVTSYNTLQNDIVYYETEHFDNLIIDEGQTIKNPRSKITQTIKSINSSFNMALTGTPIENNLLELWSLFDFIMKGYLFTESEFKRRFINQKDNKQYLRALINPFILRRTKEEVLTELPKKYENIMYVDMTDKQKEYYNNKITIYKKEALGYDNQISLLALITKLRQIALDPFIIDDNYTGGSGKLDKTIELIRGYNRDNKKVLVFSQFTSMLSRLRELLDVDNIRYYYLDGSTKAKDRIELCNEFNNTNDKNVFLISLKAGGTGLNLIAAEKVIHFDPWWNPAVENQATDRAYRIGQRNNVEVIKLISKETIEERIIKLKEKKNIIIGELLSDNSSEEYTITKDDIKYLLDI